MSRSPFEIIPLDVVKSIIPHLTLNDVPNLARTSRVNHSIFQPIADELTALLAVAHGAQATLIKLIKRTIKINPELLFNKGPITDPCGRFFESISPYQLIIFLCDEVMKDAIIPLIPEEMKSIRQQQYKELGSGGADLIKSDKKPELIKDVQTLREFKTTFTINEKQMPVTFSLLENPDGIIFYQDEHDKVHFYYVNQKTNELKRLEPEAHTVEAQQALDSLITSFMAMEKNSGRRSSDAEHQLIQQTMQRTLHRDGIRYKRDGVWFRDSRTEISLINKYRKCIRLYDEAEQTGDWDKAHQSWREEVGKAQGEVIWVLQRICEKDRPFYPLPEHFNGFKREFTFDNWNPGKRGGLVFFNGKLDDGLGRDFCLYKGAWRASCALAGCGGVAVGALLDSFAELIAVCWLVKSAKANVVEEFKPNQDLEPRGAHPKC
jgi:hypothetical protein